MPADPASAASEEALPAAAHPPPDRPRRRWTTARTVFAVVAIYLCSVAGYFWLDSSSELLQPRDLSNVDETVVLIDLTAIHPVDNTIDATVLVVPDASLLDPQFGVLNTDVTVRLYPSNDFGELNYPRGHTPGRENTTMFALGDADRWPFDSFTTGTISADVFAGSGDARRYLPARVEIAGSLNGWDVRAERAGLVGVSGATDGNATVNLSRSRGPLLLIAGFCMVLLALPAMAVFVSVELLLGRKTFQPAFSTWFAAMLFAVVPIRNVLPGNPPAGSWVDEAIVLWVLIALTGAMVTYVVAWVRRAD